MRRLNLKGAGLALACGSLVFLMSGSGWADDALITAPVNGIIYNLCTVSSTPAAKFDFLPLTNAAQSFVGPKLTVTCTVGATAVISIESGTYDTSHSGSLVSADHYASDSNGDFLAYNTTTDLAGTTPWGTLVSTNTVSATADGDPHDYTVYIQVPTGQNKLPGSDLGDGTGGVNYADTLNIDVNY